MASAHAEHLKDLQIKSVHKDYSYKIMSPKQIFLTECTII
jgi:hypothetical protein